MVSEYECLWRERERDRERESEREQCLSLFLALAASVEQTKEEVIENHFSKSRSSSWCHRKLVLSLPRFVFL